MNRKLLIMMFLIFFSACDSNQEERGSICTPPPEEFLIEDLVGTWYTGYISRNETLIINENGFYKQIIHIEYTEKPDFDYESEWQPWWVEYTDIDIPYLHLEGMRLCVYEPSLDCEQIGGGEKHWIDDCRNERIQTPGEGVLIVRGVAENFIQPQRGFKLVSFRIHSIDVTVYRLIED